MNSPSIHIDIEVIKVLYGKYKAYVLPLVSFVVAWIVFLQFILPQVTNLLTVKDQVASDEQTLAVMTQNYNVLSTLSTNELSSFTDTANKALPPTKDFAGILDAISTAAGESGVTVGDYSFQVGDINTATLQPSGNTIQLTLSIQGSIDQTKQFLTALFAQLPLSEVTHVSIAGNTGAGITAEFFYSPLAHPTFTDTNPFPTLSASQKKLLQQLSDEASTQIPSTLPVVTPTPVLTGTQNSSSAAH